MRRYGCTESLGCARKRALRLGFAAHEENGLARLRERGDECERILQPRGCLFEVDNFCPALAAEDEATMPKGGGATAHSQNARRPQKAYL